MPLRNRLVQGIPPGGTWAQVAGPTGLPSGAGVLTGNGLYNYVYHAWNRLVEVERKVVSGTAPTIGTYRYDGLERRIYKKVEHSGDRNRTEFFYYNNRWQLLEIRNQADKATRQFVWGPRYIDEAISMNVDLDGDGVCTDYDGGGAGQSHFQLKFRAAA